ncbi:MAG: carbon-nitrogen hydrolase family protein [Candidatus Tectomicrobia bacterium]|nr:carbon-nitrogen hydrolase family protein [Candidatus Tectomicrobia bacterium]
MNPPGRILAAAVQIGVDHKEPERNLPKVLEWLERAAAEGARLIAFPEGMNTRYFFRDAEDAWACSVPDPGPFVGALAEAAGRLGVTLAIGLFARRTTETGEKRSCNEVFLFGPSGTRLGVYRKNYYIKADKRWFHAGGGGFPVFETPAGLVGSFVCADARIPEVARCLALEGAEVLINCSNWGGSDQYLYHVPARGTENGCYVLAASRPRKPAESIPWDEHNYNPGSGGSFILSPDGRKLAQAGPDEETVLTAEISPRETADKRMGDGTDRFSDRRTDLYLDLGARSLPAVQGEEPASAAAVAAVQAGPGADAPVAVDRALQLCLDARLDFGSQIVVLPELFFLEGDAPARDIRGALEGSERALGKIREFCRWEGMFCAFSAAEREGDRLYHTAFLIGPEGEAGRYRKTHLSPSERAWATPGWDLPVFQTPFGRVGLLIGAEGAFPEAPRVLALRGADLLLWPTSWRDDFVPRYLAVERAQENFVFVAAANRVDSPAPGPSLLVQPMRNQLPATVKEMPPRVEGYISRLFHLADARCKRIEANTDLFAHRRPETYGALLR